MTAKRLIFLIVAIAITAAAGSAIITYQIAMSNARSVGEIYISGDEYNRLMKYFEMDDVQAGVQNAYYKDVDPDQMLIGGLKGMVEILGDGYSRFYDKDDYQYFDEKSEGSYIGLGMMLQKDEETGYAKVSQVFADTPAYENNILVGDILAEIDGKDTREIDIDNAVSRLRGQDGTEVTVKIVSSDKIMEKSLVRKPTNIQVVFADMLDETTGYIDVAEFSGKSTENFRAALETVIEEGAQSLVIDVRGTPGGYISQVADICDMLLSGGKICYTVGKKGEGNTWTASTQVLWDKPLVVLTDRQTQGVAEIFAAAIQGNGRGKVVGEKTVGKGVVISLVPIGNTGDGMKIVTGEYYSPKGERINGNGVTPDVEAEKNDAGDEDSDAQLQAALQALNPEEE